MPERQCKQCSRSFLPSSGHLACPTCRARARPRGCCKDCGTTIKFDSTRCVPCNTKSLAGTNWKGGKTYHKAGYVMLRFKDHPRA